VKPNRNGNTGTQVKRQSVNTEKHINNNQNNSGVSLNKQVQNNSNRQVNLVKQSQNQVRTAENQVRTIQNNANVQNRNSTIQQKPVQRQNVNNTQQATVRQQQNNVRSQQIVQNAKANIKNETTVQSNTAHMARMSHMTRLQKQAMYGTDKVSKIRAEQVVGKQTLGAANDYELHTVNNIANYTTKHKKERPAGSYYMLLPLSILIILIIFAVKIGIGIATQVNELKISVVSPIGSVAIDQEKFSSYMNSLGLEVDTDSIGSGITKTIACDDKYTYEINFVEFASQEDASAYYNYIIDYADEIESSYSSSITGQKSAESTLISDTYNAFMDITYIDNTLIIGIAYDSNKQDTVIDILNNLGY
jgi:hypothetical protein